MLRRLGVALALAWMARIEMVRVGRRGWCWWTADAGVGIETAGGACSWGTAGTAGAGVALRQLGLGLGWNGLRLGLVLRWLGMLMQVGTYLDVLTNLACAGAKTSGAGVAVS